jgi:hypothetical protein
LLEEKMKNILCAIFISILMGCVGVQNVWAQPDTNPPEWSVDFAEDYDEFGMGIAIENALNDDITPHEILTLLLSNNEKYHMRKGLKGLYCAGVERDTVREAADKLGITVEEVSASLEEALAECADKITLSDRDIIDNEQGNRLGLSDREITPPPEDPPVPMTPLTDDPPDLMTPPPGPQPSSPSVP